MKNERTGQTVFVGVILLLIAAVFVWQKGHAVQAQTQLSDQPLAAGWHAATVSEKKSASASIQAQLDAFRKDDYQRASFYQSAELKQHFVSTDLFRQMIKRNYPEFASYKSVSYGDAFADTNGRHVSLGVTLIGQDGVTVKATYALVLEGKIYKIEGVRGGLQAPMAPGTFA